VLLTAQVLAHGMTRPLSGDDGRRPRHGAG
jgi:hypothetical protein